MAIGFLSKDVKLYYGSTAGSESTKVDGVQEFPDLGVAPEAVDITTLDDGYMHYIPGLKDLSTLEFTLLFDNSETTSNFRALKGLEDAGSKVYWKVEFPDVPANGTHGTTFTFSGKCAVGAMGKSVNEALQFSLSIFIDSDITISDPA